MYRATVKLPRTLPTFTILFTLADEAGGGSVSGLGSISSSGARSGLSENMLSKSICEKEHKTH